MFRVNIKDLIKTPCGLAKYNELSSRAGYFSKIRLLWFIFFATLRDLSIPKMEESNQSDS